jgi:hypothetical protein
MRAAIEVYERTSAPLLFRPPETIRGYFDGLDLVEPGMVHAWNWRSEPDEPYRTGWLYAGVGRKD